MKTRKSGSFNLFKIGILLFGISMLLWNCEKEEIITNTESSIPLIDEAKNYFLLDKNHFNAKNPNSFISKIKWEDSKGLKFKKNVNILYSPLKINSNKIKSFVASIKINGEVENQIITLLYDENKNENVFSGLILIHNNAGKIIDGYQYENGGKTKRMELISTNQSYNQKSSSCEPPSLDDLLFLYENNPSGETVIFGTCVVLNDVMESNDDGGNTGNDWYYPEDDLNLDDLGPGGSGGLTWWEFDQIYNYLTNPCAKNIFTELENGLYKDDPIKPEVTIPNNENLNFSEAILAMFNNSDKIHYTILNGTTSGSNASTKGATTTISDSYLSNATKLSIARTMIHEQVHAYINALYSNFMQFNSLTFRLKLEKYAEDNGYEIGTNKFHHEFMIDYVNAMAYSLY